MTLSCSAFRRRDCLVPFLALMLVLGALFSPPDLQASFPVGEMVVVSGRYVGDGQNGRPIAGLGFRPDVVLVRAEGSQATVVRTITMAGDKSKRLGTNQSAGGKLVRSIDSDGFTLGSDAAVNAAGARYQWIAFLGAPDRMAVGSYSGNGLDDRSIAVGFQPDHVIVLSEGGQHAVQRFFGLTGDVSQTFADGKAKADRVQAFQAAGFQVGTHAEVNAAGTNYHYIAWKRSGGTVGSGTYLGDGQDNRLVADPGFRPYALFLAAQGTNQGPVQRWAPAGGDGTAPAGPTANFSNGIQALLPEGFQTGTDPRVNGTGVTYRWIAFQNARDSDLDLVLTADRAQAQLGDTLAFEVRLTNYGPDSCRSIEVEDVLPSELTVLDGLPAQGTYDVPSGHWAAGDLASGGSTTLRIAALVGASAIGRTVIERAEVTSTSTPEFFALNNADSVQVYVRGADLTVDLGVDDWTPTEGLELRLTTTASNLGPNGISGVRVSQVLSSDFAYLSHTVTAGAFDPGSGVWSVDTLSAGEKDTLLVTVRVAPGSSGRSLLSTAAITSLVPQDTEESNNADSVTVVVHPEGFKVVSGSYVGDGTAGREITGVGFQPDFVLVKGEGATVTLARTKSMPNDAAKELGVGTALLSGRVVYLAPDGFTVGADPSVNAGGTTYYWTAFLESPGQMQAGSYVGNGVDNRDITGVGFLPAHVMVFCAGGKHGVQRFAAQVGDASLPFQGVGAGGEPADRIQSLGPDGFQVGTNAEVNGLGLQYHYVAWAAAAGVTRSGTYAGDGLDDRAIEDVGFPPHFLLVARKEGGSASVARPLGVPGDKTLPVLASPAFADGLQAFLPLGFQVGTDKTVNTAGKNFFYTAFRDATGADLDVSLGVDNTIPSEGDTVRLSVGLTNHGPETASAITVFAPVPSGLTLYSDGASQGSYDAGTGIWTVGTMAKGTTASLVLATVVDEGTAGTTLHGVAQVLASEPPDPATANNADSSDFSVQSVDLEVAYRADDATPTEGEAVAFKVELRNRGPNQATGISAFVTLPGVVYEGQTASQGVFAPATGTWSAGALAPGNTATLVLLTRTASPAGSALQSVARVTALDQVDPVSANDEAGVTLRVQRPQMRVVAGSYVGDGQGGRMITGVGFQPDLLIVKGTGATPSMARSKSMSGDRSKELGLFTALLPGRVTSLDLDGFTVGVDATVNATGVTYYWTAFLEAPGQMQTGSYVGTGVDNRAITGLGFSPGYVMIAGAAARHAVQRFASEVGDATLPFDAAGEVTDRIQHFDADGFQIGSNGDVNGLDLEYHYVAWAGSGPVEAGLYLGDGQDRRSVRGLGFRPRFLLVKRLDGAFAVERSSAMEGALSLPVSAVAGLTDGVQDLLSDGFQVGTSSAVNVAGRVFMWTAFRDVAAVDLETSMAADDTLPDEGDRVVYTIRVQNHGPGTATGVALRNRLDEGLAYEAYVPDRGVYVPETGIWTLGGLAPGDSARIQVMARVGSGTAGSRLRHDVWVFTLDQTDAQPANDEAGVFVRIRSADLEVTQSVDRQSVLEGETVTFTLGVHNAGPDSATGIRVRNIVPSGLDPQGAAPSRGTYEAETGIWSVGSLAVSDSATLVLTAEVEAGTAGSTLIHAAGVLAADQADSRPANDADTLDVYVAYGPGLLILGDQLSMPTHPGESRASIMQLVIRNSSSESRVLNRLRFTNRSWGPGSAAQRDAELGRLALYAAQGSDHVEVGLDSVVAYAQAVAQKVTFEDLDVPVPAGSVVALELAAEVPLDARDGDTLDVEIEGAADAAFDLAITPLNSWPIDPPGKRAVDGMAAAQIAVRPVGSTVRAASVRVLALDVVLPANGYEPDVLEAIRLVNRGDAEAGVDIERVELWGDGGNGEFDAGTQDDFTMGQAAWTGSFWARVGLSIPIPVTGRRVFASVDVSEGARPDRAIRLVLPAGSIPAVQVASANDGPVDADAGSPEAMVTRPGLSVIDLMVHPQTVRVLWPGRGGVDILALDIANRAAYPETLRSLTVTNSTHGTGLPAELDAEWLPLDVFAGGSTGAGVSFSASHAVFSDLDLIVPAGDTLAVRFVSGASRAARDGDVLDLQINPLVDVVFSRPVRILGSALLDPPGGFTVDGMVAAQIDQGLRTPPDILTGSVRNVVLDLVVPPNGYAPDTLSLLYVRNLGNAVPGTDIVRVEAWTDDGDGRFEPDADSRLGEMQLSGGSWFLADFVVAVPAGGRRLFVSCDIARDAVEGRTLRMALPAHPIPGLNMASPNDGPRDEDVVNPVSMTITTVDRLSLSAGALAPGPVNPGQDRVPVLHLVGRNTFLDQNKTLTGLVVANLTNDPEGGTQGELDAQIRRLELHPDDPGAPAIGTAIYSGGKAIFTGFTWDVAPGTTRSLYVTALVAPDAADRCVLGAQVENDASLTLAEATNLSVRFPLDSGAAWTVDGMTIHQITNHGAPNAIIAPGEGPVLALDWLVPRNGPHDDVLEQVKLVNAGSALPEDIDEMSLWKDGGNGVFDAGMGDDVPLGPFTSVSDKWVSSILTEPVTLGGLRLFAAVSAAAGARDSVTVRMAIPPLGLSVASGNDGPIDDAVVNGEEIRISKSSLLSALILDGTNGVIGDTAVVRLVVRNLGSLAVLDVTPSVLLSTPNGVFSSLTGPEPAAQSIPTGGAGEFVWKVRAAAAGTARFQVEASGTELGTGRVVRAAGGNGPAYHVYRPVTTLNLFPVQSMPFSVSPGQEYVVPLALTLTHPGGEDVSDVLFRGVTLRLERESGAGIVPAQLLSRVRLSEGTKVYAELSTLPGAGATVELVILHPVRIQAADVTGGQATLSLSLDLLAAVTVPDFRLVIGDAAGLAAEDANNGAPVTAILEGGLAYPVRSGLTRVVGRAGELGVTGNLAESRTVGRGQHDVPLLGLGLTNPGITGIGLDLKLSRFAVELVDANGDVQGDVARVLGRVMVKSGSTLLLDRAVSAGTGSVLELTFPSPIVVPVNGDVPVDLTADIVDDAELGTVRLRLTGPAGMVARSSGSGDSVGVAFASEFVQGGHVTVQGRADRLQTRVVPGLPPTLFLGTADAKVFDLILSHPGASNAGAIRCDALLMRLRDDANRPLVPATFVDRVRVLQNGAEIGATADLPVAGGEFSVPLGGIRLEPGGRATLEIRCDIEAAAPVGYIQMLVSADGIAAYDANVGARVEIAPEAGSEFPLASGLARLATPARELSAGFRESMPAQLVGDGRSVPVARIALRNPATAGEIKIEALEIGAAGSDYQEVPVGAKVSVLRAFVADTLWAEQDGIAPGAATARLTGSTPLTVGAGDALEIELYIAVRPEASGVFRLGCPRDGVRIVQPASSLLAVNLVAEEGQTFPFWTETASVGERSLAATYSNFPNPFAAGREATAFVYYLDRDARVTLKVVSARGEDVTTILDDALRGVGLHQEDRWDGRNGQGKAVRNGVYMAEITVRFPDGSSERLLRKLAVVR